MSYLNELTPEQRQQLTDKSQLARKAKSEANKQKKYKTIRAAVKAHCIGCIYDPLAGGTSIQQITNCPVTRCELYEWRPISKASSSKD